jgi:DNA-directed RNA polymerase specialized sigma24 family protein
MCRRGLTLADAADATSEVILEALAALRHGRYEHRSEPEFHAWLFTIARRTAAARRRADAIVLADGDADREPSDGPGPEGGAALRELWQVLMEALDGVLLRDAGTPDRRARAELRRAAFFLYYHDRHPQPAILRTLVPAGRALRPPVRVTATMLNNWLSRGDIVNGIARWVVTQRPGVLAEPRRRQLVETSVAPDDRPLATLLVEQGLSEARAADQLGLPLAEVSAGAARIRSRVAEELGRRMRADLHALRHGGEIDSDAAHDGEEGPAGVSG